MKNIRQHTMLTLIAFVGSTVAHTEYFSRNTGVVASSRDRYQFNLPVDSSNNTYNSSPLAYALNPLFADEYVVRQYGQSEVPQYSRERGTNRSTLMEEGRVAAQQQALQEAQQGQAGQTQQAKIPADYSQTMQPTNMPAQQGILLRDTQVPARQ